MRQKLKPVTDGDLLQCRLSVLGSVWELNDGAGNFLFS